jgi:hypothetical protein
MNENGTITATDGASLGRRRLASLLNFNFVFNVVLVAALVSPACSRSGTQGNEQAQAPLTVDPALARAVAAALQPCIRAHKTPTSSVYTAQLRLERQPAGTAAATFTGERTAGHADFETCAVKAINAAAITLPQTTTLPVAFDFGPEPAAPSAR